MSLLNKDFIAFDGTPITGRVPTQIQVYADQGYEMSEELRGMVAHAYKLFCDSVKVSAIPDGYHVQNRELADGSKVRMESNKSVHRVMVWPVGSGDEQNPGEVATFFCVPFDYSYRTAPVEDVYYIKRWPNAALLVDKAAVLDGLKFAKKHVMFPPTDSAQDTKPVHPGNQTWFANSHDPDHPHKYRHFVLSWWGQSNRYYTSPTIETTAENFAWGRSQRQDGKAWNDTATVDTEYYKGAPGLTFAPYSNLQQSGDMYGTSWYRVPGDNTTVYGNLINYPYSQMGSTARYLFVNAYRVKLPWAILSACIAERNGTAVLRIVPISNFKYPVYIYEVSLDIFLKKAFEEKGRGELVSTDFQSFTLPTIAGGTHQWQIQPPYWNADGTKAIGHLATSNTYNGNVTTGSIIYEIDAAALTVTVVKTSTYTKTADDGLSWSCSGERLLAADYRGNERRVVTEEFESSSTAGTNQASGATLSRLLLNGNSIATWSRNESYSVTTDTADGSNWTTTGVTTKSGIAWSHCPIGGDIRDGKLLLNRSGGDLNWHELSQTITQQVINGSPQNPMRTLVETYKYDRVVALDLNTLTFTDVHSVPDFTLSETAQTSGGGSFVEGIVHYPSAYGNPGGGLGTFTFSYAVNKGCGFAKQSGVASGSALSPDGKIQYVGVSIPSSVAYHWADPIIPQATLDLWFVDGVLVTPNKAYPKSGDGKMLSSPVFLGPLPPLRNQPKKVTK